MQILTKPEELASLCRDWHKAGDDIALTPTMGYYHAGHEDLIRHGRKLAKRIVVSLFVNPTQFGPHEDLAAYPRDIESDCAKARGIGADAIFIPEPSAMYAPDHATWVEVPALASGLCGKSRPIHFRGVCTVVLKLMLLTGADYAVFGQKDWQQQAIIRRMVRDLNVPCTIVTIPTVREDDGLAMSSRNVYLKPKERKAAPHIRKGLLLAREIVASGEQSPGKVIDAVLDYWKTNLPNGEVDYIEIVDPESLEPLADLSGAALMACAVKLGKARLIDNIEFKQA
ncbi:MAG: pantoate--beta-alanine ligase [Desulfovibrio sp.]|nr:pantoate--beta-alanine ligase [Desulfovibrio sp.]